MTPVAHKPVIIIIFGITGDLAQRKLLPALYHLLKDGLLHEDSVILGITRRDVTAEQLLGQVELCVSSIDNVCDPAGIRKVQTALRMYQMGLEDGAEYDGLRRHIDDIEAEKGICMDRLIYLSIPPQTFEPIVRNLGQHGLNTSCRHGAAASRLLVEKPFGYDTRSAEALIEETSKWFDEEQLFRIDHYVAKDTVQNIIEFRDSSSIIRAIWDSQHIECIEITAYETITIEGRAVFYEGVGALRDFIQSHLLQLLTVVTMELPQGGSSQDVHANKLQLLKSIVPVQPDRVTAESVRGQYAGYRDEVHNPQTRTETYAELTVAIDNPRWQGVPMTIRTGKALARKLTEIRVVFRGSHEHAANRSQLVFSIQPDEGITLQVEDPKPAFARELADAVMKFQSHQREKHQASATPGHPDAYERVLLEAALGDHTLFTTSGEVLAAWRIVEHVLRAWSASDEGLVSYPKGSARVSAQ